MKVAYARFIFRMVLKNLVKSAFSWCKSLSHVTFGESSSLKLIGKGAFSESGVCEIHIPDGVEVVPCDASPRYTRIVKPLSRRGCH